MLAVVVGRRKIYFILSYLILSYLILSYLILSYLILSYLILSYLILSYLILFAKYTSIQTKRTVKTRDFFGKSVKKVS